MTLGTLTVPTVIVIILGVQGVIMGVLEFISGFRGGGFGVIHSRGDKAPCRLQAPSATQPATPADRLLTQWNVLGGFCDGC